MTSGDRLLYTHIYLPPPSFPFRTHPYRLYLATYTHTLLLCRVSVLLHISHTRTPSLSCMRPHQQYPNYTHTLLSCCVCLLVNNPHEHAQQNTAWYFKIICGEEEAVFYCSNLHTHTPWKLCICPHQLSTRTRMCLLHWCVYTLLHCCVCVDGVWGHIHDKEGTPALFCVCHSFTVVHVSSSTIHTLIHNVFSYTIYTHTLLRCCVCVYVCMCMLCMCMCMCMCMCPHQQSTRTRTTKYHNKIPVCICTIQYLRYSHNKILTFVHNKIPTCLALSIVCYSLYL